MNKTFGRPRTIFTVCQIHVIDKKMGCGNLETAVGYSSTLLMLYGNWVLETVEQKFRKKKKSKSQTYFLAHLSAECSVSYCDHLPFVGVRPSVYNFLVYTLATTNINQSTPNFVKIYMTTKFCMFYYGTNRTRTPSCLPLN